MLKIHKIVIVVKHIRFYRGMNHLGIDFGENLKIGRVSVQGEELGESDKPPHIWKNRANRHHFVLRDEELHLPGSLEDRLRGTWCGILSQAHSHDNEEQSGLARPLARF